MLTGAGPALAENSRLPTLYTNEQLIDDATRQTSLDVDDTKAVLAYVLGELPERVRVVPTENYYYFYFYQNGIRYAGNLRFDLGERDKGLVEFIYFKDTTDWANDEEDHHATLGPSDGVVLKKTGNLVYDLRFGGRTVTFELNDLSSVRPPDGALRENEQFLGPVADESGMRFYLIFDQALKAFYYVLDETAPLGDELIPTEGMSHILIGRRTGFAFFQEDTLGRKVLVGVYAPNIDVNNYLDGPFDQLPDNFLKGDELRRAIIAADPEVRRPIDRLGISPGGDFRVSITPYLEYVSIDDLAPAEKCAGKANEVDIYACVRALATE